MDKKKELEKKIIELKQKISELEIKRKSVYGINKKLNERNNDLKVSADKLLDSLIGLQKKIKGKAIEYRVAEQDLVIVLGEVAVAKDRISEETQKVKNKLEGIVEQEKELREKICYYHESCNNIATDKQSLVKSMADVEVQMHNYLRESRELQREKEELRKAIRESTDSVAGNKAGTMAAKLVKDKYEGMIKAQVKVNIDLKQSQANLDKELRKIEGRNANLRIMENTAAEREGEAVVLKNSFEKQIEALDDRESALEIIKLKLTKEATKMKMKKELEQLQKA